MKFNKIILFFVLYFSVANFQAQDSIVFKDLRDIPAHLLQKDEDGNVYYYDAKERATIYEINGERIIILDELVFLAKPKFNNSLDKTYYFFLNKKLTKVYPIFLKTLSRYRNIDNQVKAMKSKKEKRQYIQGIQEDFAEEYKGIIMDLTPTEGQVFVKLMSRATGKTVHETIKELRGSWSAFWWNAKGEALDVSLKMPYNPHKNRDDEYIESLLQSSWSIGILSPYPGCETYKRD